MKIQFVHVKVDYKLVKLYQNFNLNIHMSHIIQTSSKWRFLIFYNPKFYLKIYVSDVQPY